MKNKLLSNFIYGFKPAILAVVLIWLPFAVEKFYHISLSSWGILPRTVDGIPGILFAPFLHGDLIHLANNTIPLFVLIAYLHIFYKELLSRIVLWSIFMTGLFVWLSARGNYHIGASGVVYALSSFLFFSGLVRKNTTLMAVSLTVAFLYGSLIWGIFPLEKRVSWESHLWGSVSGLILAFYYRKIGQQKTKFPFQMLNEEDYLSDNVNKYGPYYWDPVKQAAYLREQELRHSTSEGPVEIIYHFKAKSEG